MKNLVMAFLVLVAIMLPLVALADSGSWTSMEMAGGTDVYRYGFSNIQMETFGQSHTHSLSGETVTVINARLDGGAHANHGAAMNQGRANINTTASESPWGTYTATIAGSSSNTASVGNASASQMTGVSVYIVTRN